MPKTTLVSTGEKEPTSTELDTRKNARPQKIQRERKTKLTQATMPHRNQTKTMRREKSDQHQKSLEQNRRRAVLLACSCAGS
jgi:hypothetical protein